VERILVVAPHPDDEAIALGGWLADRGAAGAEIWAVIMTDGEAFPKAVRQNHLSRWPILRAPDFLRLGRLRREEGRQSLEILGIPAERRFFLGYPTNILWRILHSTDPSEPVRSKATGQRFGIAEWPIGEEKTHPFSRLSWAADLDTILHQSRPGTILIPSPFDTNADHRAVLQMLIQRLQANRLSPALLGYVVHHTSRRQFPHPLGYHPREELRPPAGFPSPIKVYPSAAALSTKERALRSHRTQINLKDGFLLGFIRVNELYWPLKPEDFPSLSWPNAQMAEQETLESETGSR